GEVRREGLAGAEVCERGQEWDALLAYAGEIAADPAECCGAFRTRICMTDWWLGLLTACRRDSEMAIGYAPHHHAPAPLLWATVSTPCSAASVPLPACSPYLGGPARMSEHVPPSS